ncbi:hypothetical protein ACFXTI_006548 [Malus domestica]
MNGIVDDYDKDGGEGSDRPTRSFLRRRLDEQSRAVEQTFSRGIDKLHDVICSTSEVQNRLLEILVSKVCDDRSFDLSQQFPQRNNLLPIVQAEPIPTRLKPIDLEKKGRSSSRIDRPDQRMEVTVSICLVYQPSPNSIQSWEELVERFHEQFYRQGMKMSVSSLTRMAQASDESPMDYLTRFKSAKNWCRVHLPEVEFVKLALNRLDVEYKKKFLGANFQDMYELAQHVEQYDYFLQEEKVAKPSSRGTIYKSPTEVKTCLAIEETARTSKVYTFDITKAEAIFDQLLSAKIIKLRSGHSIPKVEELKGRTYCKYHNSTKHATNNYVIFRDDIQSWIDKGKLKFLEKRMTVDADPFEGLFCENMFI